MSFQAVPTRLSVAFSLDGKYIAAGGSDGAIVWAIGNGEEVSQITDDYGAIWAISFSPDGKFIVIGDGFHPFTGGRSTTFTTSVRETLTGKQVTLVKHNDSNGINSVAFSQDGNYIVSGGGPYAGIWETTTGKEIVRMENEEDIYEQTAVVRPDGEYALSVGGNAVRIWDINAEASRMTHENWVSSAVFSPDGKKSFHTNVAKQCLTKELIVCNPKYIYGMPLQGKN